MTTTPLNIFYQEPDPDRWIKYDRYPRKVVRRIVRGKFKPGGMMRVSLQLMEGLDQINKPYRFNAFNYATQHSDEVACIIGKPQLLLERQWENPVILGPCIFSHPLNCSDLFTRYPNIKKVIVHSDWMYRMFEPYYGKENLAVWPVGIDTCKWNPRLKQPEPALDFLIYNKILWQGEKKEKNLLSPIITELETGGFTYDIIKYGSYNHQTLIEKLSNSKAVIFLCEHETQGLAYQQILATGTPILAWDKGAMWEDPEFYPQRVQFEGVSSVPYWDDRCGLKFKDLNDFKIQLTAYIQKLGHGGFAPRNYILENLELGKQAAKFAKIVQSVKGSL